MEFGLSRHHDAHTSDARCVIGLDGLVASGGRDSLLKLWLRDGDAVAVQEAKWVNAVTSVAPGRVKCCMHGGIVTGGQDGLIRIYSFEGQSLHLQHALQAHDAPVCSLSWLDWQGQLLLLSGGWDSVAKVWELPSADDCKCTPTTLSGHENNVCVLGLANGDIITGSSGVFDQAADCVTGFQLRVWRDASVVQAIGQGDGGHAGAIRDLAAMPLEGSCTAFASASNDGTVGVWLMSEGTEAKARAKYHRALTLAVPSESFIFSVCYAAPSRSSSTTSIGGTLFTADDAGELCVFDLSTGMSTDDTRSEALLPVQRIRHPKTLWNVAVISATTEAPQMEASGLAAVDAHVGGTSVVATACADGAVRLFTTDRALQLPASEQQESLSLKTAPPPTGHDYSMSTKLQRVSERDQFIGAEPGAISLFLDDEGEGVSAVGSAAAVVACQWVESRDASGAGWVKLGRVLDPIAKQPSTDEQKTQQEKQELDGEFFDQIIPVEVESASKGQLSLLLGINAGDDSKSVATKFCQKHGRADNRGDDQAGHDSKYNRQISHGSSIYV